MNTLVNPYIFENVVEWHPRDISGLIHLSIAERLGLDDGDEIDTWTDLSGNGNDAVSIGSTPVIYREGYNTFVESGVTTGKPFSGFFPSNSTLPCIFSFGNILSALTAATVFIVVNVTTRGWLQPVPRQEYHLGLWQGTFFPYSDYKIRETFGSTTTHATTSPVSNLGFYWRSYIVTTKASEYKMYLDGTQIYTSGTNTVSFPAEFKFGQNTEGDTYTWPWPNAYTIYPYFWGGIRVFGLYNKALSASEVTFLHNYLKEYITPIK